MRKGLTFHDGGTFTAEDVKATYQRILAPPTGVSIPRTPLFAAVSEIKFGTLNGSIKNVDCMVRDINTFKLWSGAIQAMLYVKGHDPSNYFGVYDVVRFDTFWLDKV